MVKQATRNVRRANFGGARATLLGKARPLFVQWLAQINQFIDFQEAANKTIAAEWTGPRRCSRS